MTVLLFVLLSRLARSSNGDKATSGFYPISMGFAYEEVNREKSQENGSKEGKLLTIKLSGTDSVEANAPKTLLTGPDPMAVNDFARPRTVLPDTFTVTVEPSFLYEAPPCSLTVIRMRTR